MRTIPKLTINPGISPRAWQREAVEAWAPTMRGMAQVVTGGGKTIFAFLCIERFLEEFPEGRVVIVVPTVALLDQWGVAVQEDFGAIDGNVAFYSGSERSESPAVINLCVINTARTWTERLSSQSDTMLIVDECHRAGTPVNSLALRGRFRAALGLSATPFREYDDGFEEYLVPVLGPVIFQYGYRQAHRDGILSDFELVNVEVPLSQTEADNYAKLTKRIGRLSSGVAAGAVSEDQLARVLQLRAGVVSQAHARIPAAVRLIERHGAERAILFHERITSADAILGLLRRRGHSATIYHSHVGESVRRDNLRLFRRGVFDVLVTCRALDEGLNVPDVSIGVIASATASSRQRIQRLGRLLRPAHGKTRAMIYTLFASVPEKERLAREAREMAEIAAVHWERMRGPNDE
jgi:superfamily II DNA or RNA helicase